MHILSAANLCGKGVFQVILGHYRLLLPTESKKLGVTVGAQFC